MSPQAIPQAELIERWENCLRVLEAMPEHDRKKHWNMGEWGRKTACGTVACAAGHCGLDPWFRERGFTLNFDDEGASEISDSSEFFGNEGSWSIFLNSARRPVETVIDEVKVYIDDLKQCAALAASIGAPALGEPWPEHGGIFSGVIRGKEGISYILISGPEREAATGWNTAMEWAASLDVEGLKDFTLPTLIEQRRLMDNVPQLFEREWYWSSEQHADGSRCAWGQTFYGGTQDHWSKVSKLRARAVRRITI